MFPTQELDAEFSPAPGPGWNKSPERETGGTIPATPKTAIHHRTGDAEFGSPETQQWTGRVSGADVHANTNQSEMVVESTRVTGVDKLEESDTNNALETQVDGERRVRKFGMKLTATLLFSFSQTCHDWNRSKIVQPHLDTLYVSRLDELEIGGRPNSVL